MGWIRSLHRKKRTTERIAVAFLGLIALAACSTLEIHTDHDPTADFSAYKTYAWAPLEKGQAAPDISGVPSPLIEQRIRSAVDSRLTAKGLHLAREGEEPDLYIHDRLAERQKVEAYGSGLGFGGGYGFGPWSTFAYSPSYETRQYTEGSLVLDFVDSKTAKLVWRGIATDALESPEKSAEQINEAVTAALEKYPPAPGDQKTS